MGPRSERPAAALLSRNQNSLPESGLTCPAGGRSSGDSCNEDTTIATLDSPEQMVHHHNLNRMKTKM